MGITRKKQGIKINNSKNIVKAGYKHFVKKKMNIWNPIRHFQSGLQLFSLIYPGRRFNWKSNHRWQPDSMQCDYENWTNTSDIETVEIECDKDKYTLYIYICMSDSDNIQVPAWKNVYETKTEKNIITYQLYNASSVIWCCSDFVDHESIYSK